MRTFDVILDWLMLSVSAVVVARGIRACARRSWVIAIAAVPFAVLGMYGQSTLLMCRSIFGLSRYVKSDFEWPVAPDPEAVHDSQGRIYVALPNIQRVQAYNADGRFLSGCFFESNGGAFWLHVTEDDCLEIFVVRGSRRYVFTANGRLVSRDKYDWRETEILPAGPTCRFRSRTPWYLLPLASRGVADLISVIGMGGLLLMYMMARRSVLRKKTRTEDPAET